MLPVRNTPTPLYAQVKGALLALIESGVWKSGELLPSEKALQQEFGVSRGTIRQALQELTQEGLLSRWPGKGTYLLSSKVPASPISSGLLIDYLLQQGLNIESRISNFTIDPEPPAPASSFLDFSPGLEKCLVYTRLILLEGEPLGVSHVVVVLPSGCEVVEEDLKGATSITRLLARDFRILASKGTRTLEAVIPTQAEAETLGIDATVPTMRAKSQLISLEGRRFIFTDAMFRGDRFQYVSPLAFFPTSDEGGATT